MGDRYVTPPHIIRANHEKNNIYLFCARTFKNKAMYVLFVQILDWKSLCNHLITKYLINYLMLMLCNCYIGGKGGLTD